MAPPSTVEKLLTLFLQFIRRAASFVFVTPAHVWTRGIRVSWSRKVPKTFTSMASSLNRADGEELTLILLRSLIQHTLPPWDSVSVSPICSEIHCLFHSCFLRKMQGMPTSFGKQISNMALIPSITWSWKTSYFLLAILWNAIEIFSWWPQGLWRLSVIWLQIHLVVPWSRWPLSEEVREPAGCCGLCCSGSLRDRRRREILLWGSHPWSQGLLLVCCLVHYRTVYKVNPRSHPRFMLGSSDSRRMPCPSQVWPPSGQRGSHRCRLTHPLLPGEWVLRCSRSPPSSQQQTVIPLEPLFLVPNLPLTSHVSTNCLSMNSHLFSLHSSFYFFYMQFLKVAFHLQLVQSIVAIPHAVQYSLEPVLYPVGWTFHSPIPCPHPSPWLVCSVSVSRLLFGVFTSLLYVLDSTYKWCRTVLVFL